jgi:hypothetical protein
MSTWNIIFIGLDIHDKAKYSSLIEKTKMRFLEQFKQVRQFPEGQNIFNYICLNYVKKGPRGKAELIYNTPGETDCNKRFTVEKDWYKTGSYSSVLKPIIAQNTMFSKQKLLVIFVAHSFGAGFAPYKRKDKTKFMVTEKLKKIFLSSFGTKKIDCLMALNCSIQSVETNLILADSTEYIIGSQVELYPDTIDFKHLRWAIQYRKAFGDELMWSRFLYDCFVTYTSETERRGDTERKFSISLSKPAKLTSVISVMNESGRLLMKEDKESEDVSYLANIFNEMSDPNHSDQGYIYDCKQLFLMVKNSFRQNKRIQKASQKVFDCIHQSVILSISSSNAHMVRLDERENGVPSFVPFGMGVFFPKRAGDRSDIIRNIFGDSLAPAKKNNRKADKSLKDWFSLMNYYLNK